MIHLFLYLKKHVAHENPISSVIAVYMCNVELGLEIMTLPYLCNTYECQLNMALYIILNCYNLTVGLSRSLLTTDADVVTDYGLQVFTLEPSGVLSFNNEALFPDKVPWPIIHMPAILHRSCIFACHTQVPLFACCRMIDLCLYL